MSTPHEIVAAHWEKRTTTDNAELDKVAEAYSEALGLKKEALLTQAVAGMKTLGAGMRGQGLKMLKNTEGPQALSGHLKRQAGKALSTAGRAVQKNPGTALGASTAAGLWGTGAALTARRKLQGGGDRS